MTINSPQFPCPSHKFRARQSMAVMVLFFEDQVRGRLGRHILLFYCINSFKNKVSFNERGSPFKIYSRTNTLTNQMDVFVACNSYEDAFNTAMIMASVGLTVMHEGIAYNYHYYFGDNSHGRIARQKKEAMNTTRITF